MAELAVFLLGFICGGVALAALAIWMGSNDD